MKELERDINRYSIDCSHQLAADITRDLLLYPASNLYVIKLVPSSQQGQLPNLRITKESDLAILPEFLTQHERLRAEEIWYCRTVIRDDVFSVAGRISFDPESLPRAQVIEQVWRCSPRLIETFGSEFSYPYARASRCHWGWHYSIEELHAPPGVDPQAQEQEFLRSLILIEKRREDVELFLAYLEEKGEKSISLEYKIISTEVSFIDWDTKNDRGVLRP